MNPILVATLAFGLEALSDEELCALNLAVQTEGRVEPENLAFESCVERKLIRENGTLWDVEVMRRICHAEGSRRFESKRDK